MVPSPPVSATVVDLPKSIFPMSHRASVSGTDKKAQPPRANAGDQQRYDDKFEKCRLFKNDHIVGSVL